MAASILVPGYTVNQMTSVIAKITAAGTAEAFVNGVWIEYVSSVHPELR